MRKLLVITLLVATAAAQTFYRLPTPYTYSCRESRCIKEDRSGSRETRSLESCQLTCGRYGALWPQPTGDVELSRETVSFSPKNVRVTKMAATSPKVSQMLEDAVNYFTRNIHFLHPDFPKDKKTPFVQEEQFFDNKDSVDAYQVIQQQRLRTEQVNQEAIEQQQRQQQVYSTINEKTEKYLKYSPFLRARSTPAADNHDLNIEITVTSPEDKLTLETDESYTLVVQTARQDTTATIVATSYYGARHALESLTQLIAFDDNNNALQIVQNAKIQDAPQFKYRGVMLDTARNYYPKEDLMRFLDAMSYNKMNYFHWHITDASSFPMYSSRRPEMAYYGAYSPRDVYYPEDITQIVEYAKLRGIKVIPELDGPAHVNAGWQWGEKEGKGKLVLCTDSEKQPWFEVGKEPPSGQFNPVNPELYTVLEEIYRDMMDYFDPEMVHMGGDGVSFKCWQNSQEIKEYLAANNREPISQEYFDLWNTYQQNAYAKLREASGPYRKVTPIIQASSYALNYADKENYIVQLSQSANDPSIARYINEGFKVIFSNEDQWRLDCVANRFYGEKAESCSTEAPTWRNFYENSPLDMLTNLGVSNARSTQLRSGQTNTIRDQVLGGEATLWSFDTDANGADAKSWPRVSAMAERLWTDPITPVNIAEDTAAKRINIQRKRMADLGVRADPIQPQYCMQDESACYSQEQYLARSADTTKPQPVSQQ